MTLKNRTFLIVPIILVLSLPLTGCRGKLFAARPITSLKTPSLAVSKDETSARLASISPAKAERLFEPLGDGRLGTAERLIEPRAEKPGLVAERLPEPRGEEKVAKAERFLEPHAQKPGKDPFGSRGEDKLAKEERLVESRGEKFIKEEPLVERHGKDKAEKPDRDKHK